MTKKTVHEEYNERGKRICGANKSNNRGKCQNAPLIGGNGRCKFHGGMSTGAPKGNKNGLKTGMHESIVYNILPDEEKEIYDNIEIDTLKVLDDSIKILKIRELRMLNRVEALRDQEMLIIEKIKMSQGNLHSISVKESSTLLEIQKIEADITKVQHQIMKTIQARHNAMMELADTEDDSNLDQLVDAINNSVNKQIDNKLSPAYQQDQNTENNESDNE